MCNFLFILKYRIVSYHFRTKVNFLSTSTTRLYLDRLKTRITQSNFHPGPAKLKKKRNNYNYYTSNLILMKDKIHANKNIFIYIHNINIIISDQ